MARVPKEEKKRELTNEEGLHDELQHQQQQKTKNKTKKTKNKR